MYLKNEKDLYIKYSSKICMKKKLVYVYIYLPVLFLLAIINGCSDSVEDKTTGAVVKEPLCNAPYFEFKTGECCLDSNSNRICDSDEQAVVAEEPAQEEVPTEPKEIEITLKDSCTDTTYLECDASYLTKDEVFFKFKTKREGFLHLKKVSALGCLVDFPDKTKATDGYVIRSDILVSIPCKIYEPGKEVEGSEYTTEYIFYPDDGFINPSTGNWEGAPRNLQKSSGQISGTVRSEPKKLL